MNGYTSITAVISEHDIKLTKYVDIPYAVVLDTEYHSQRLPPAMIQAGVGDLAARTICNADWKLSQLPARYLFLPAPLPDDRLIRSHVPGFGRRHSPG